MSDSASLPSLAPFEKWLRTVCFQKPTPEAYDLAKCAYAAALASQPVPAADDMVPRSRLHAMEGELQEAADKLTKVRANATAEINRLVAMLSTAQPVPAIYEQRLRSVLDVVQRYLPPVCISIDAAMSEIIVLVDPWPAASQPVPSVQSGLTNDALDALIESALPLLGATGKALTFIRWKDGIDVEYVTPDARRFVRAMLTASQPSVAVGGSLSVPAGCDWHLVQHKPQGSHGWAAEIEPLYAAPTLPKGTREVMQQALDMLEEAVTYTVSPWFSPGMASKCNSAIVALRSHLALAVKE